MHRPSIALAAYVLGLFLLGACSEDGSPRADAGLPGIDAATSDAALSRPDSGDAGSELDAGAALDAGGGDAGGGDAGGAEDAGPLLPFQPELYATIEVYNGDAPHTDVRLEIIRDRAAGRCPLYFEDGCIVRLCGGAPVTRVAGATFTLDGALVSLPNMVLTSDGEGVYAPARAEAAFWPAGGGSFSWTVTDFGVDGVGSLGVTRPRRTISAPVLSSLASGIDRASGLTVTFTTSSPLPHYVRLKTAGVSDRTANLLTCSYGDGGTSVSDASIPAAMLSRLPAGNYDLLIGTGYEAGTPTLTDEGDTFTGNSLIMTVAVDESGAYAAAPVTLR